MTGFLADSQHSSRAKQGIVERSTAAVSYSGPVEDNLEAESNHEDECRTTLVRVRRCPDPTAAGQRPASRGASHGGAAVEERLHGRMPLGHAPNLSHALVMRPGELGLKQCAVVPSMSAPDKHEGESIAPDGFGKLEAGLSRRGDGEGNVERESLWNGRRPGVGRRILAWGEGRRKGGDDLSERSGGRCVGVRVYAPVEEAFEAM
jgi:hypothetical protein